MRRSLAVLLLVLPSSVYAWGNAGHQITAEVADRQLSDAVAARVLHLLHNRHLADVATIPDTVKNTEGGQVTRDWHFVDILDSNAAFVDARDCAFDDCIVDRIEALKHILADPNESNPRKADALIYLTHFVGDIHQPLHCTTGLLDNGTSDRGGNGIIVTIPKSVNLGSQQVQKHPNLHGIWDTTILAIRGLSINDYADHLLNDTLAGRDPDTLNGGSPVDWANESHTIAHQVYKKNGDTLDQQYFDDNQQVVDERLLKGGLRLAKVIEDALGAP